MEFLLVSKKLAMLEVNSTKPTTSKAIVCLVFQPLSLALENPTTRQAQPVIIKTSPRKSNVLDNCVQVNLFLAGRFKVKYSAGIASPHAGRLIRKTHLQLALSQIRPPNNGPMTDALRKSVTRVRRGNECIQSMDASTYIPQIDPTQEFAD